MVQMERAPPLLGGTTVSIKGKWEQPVQVRWNREEDEVLRERWGVFRPKVISSVLGRSQGSIFQRAARLGLKGNRGTKDAA